MEYDTKFHIGEQVIYGATGVCTVQDIGTPDIAGVEGLYYILKPMYDNKSTVFTPVNSQKVIMRSVLSSEQAEEILNRLEHAAEDEAFAEKLKPFQYAEILKSADCLQLAHLVRGLYKTKKSCAINKRKMTSVDTRTLRSAEILFYGELATVFGKSMEETRKDIRAVLYNK